MEWGSTNQRTIYHLQQRGKGMVEPESFPPSHFNNAVSGIFFSQKKLFWKIFEKKCGFLIRD
ncbi:MAG: hypothetical protein D5R99_01955 [Methanocalculus sp. MSAO_Arc1]|nr:MAG: hypothetical protein D5R99_01955 [Methanocalculus sp. MSAO_Arc1]